MARVEPVPDAPAATATLAGDRTLLIADYHAGIEAGLRYERGVELASAADERRERVVSLIDTVDAERLVILGDLGHQIGASEGAERREVHELLDAVSVPVTLARGNHDAGVVETAGDRLEALPAEGERVGDVGLFHGHTWPARALSDATVICMGHEHPLVRLQDTVGGSRIERAWLRGRVDLPAFADAALDSTRSGESDPPELIVFPAFNDRSGGTRVNDSDSFLAPFLPEAMPEAQVYLLDGTRLGGIDDV